MRAISCRRPAPSATVPSRSRALVKAAAFSLSLTLACADAAARWGCRGAKPGHPTAEERTRFVREVSMLAVRAERAHGVPASALAAISIAESAYGWTRVAIDANNVFGWKAWRDEARAGRAYLPDCERRRGVRYGFVRFESRAHAFDFVASRLKEAPAYREHSAAYLAARRSGIDAEVAVDAWLSGIAQSYSRQPKRFVSRIRRIMNDPEAPSDALSAQTTLYRLSADVRWRH